MSEKDREIGPLTSAQQEQDKWRNKELMKAAVIVGHELSITEKRSQSYPMLYDIWVKLRGLSQ